MRRERLRRSPRLRRFRLGALRAALLAAPCLLGVAGLASCRTPLVPALRDDARALSLVEGLRGEARARRALRGSARMYVDGGDGSVRAHYALVIERPARLRVEIRGFLGETVAVLVTDGTSYDVFYAADRSRESGRVYPTLLLDVAGIPLTPAEAVDLLLGAPLPQPGLALRGSAVEGDGRVTAEYADREGALEQRFEFDAEGKLRRIEMRAGEGDAREVLWDARFDAYDDLAGSAFAHDVALDFPALASSARIRLRDVELNPELTPDVFVLKVPGG